MFMDSKNVQKMTLMSDENGFIKGWKNRIKEIEQTGNCLNKNVHMPRPYFDKRMTTERMIAFCEKMIYRLEKREL